MAMRKQVERWMLARGALFCAESAGWDTSGQRRLLAMAEEDIRAALKQEDR